MIRRREDNRGPWYLLTGLVLGLAIGLLISWVLAPVKYVDTAPFSLRADYKDQYRSLIAAAYQSDGDLGRARSRLALLQDSDPLQALVGQAQRVVSTGGPGNDSRALAVLAAALGQAPGQSAVALRPSQSLAPAATSTPVPTETATLTLTPSLVPATGTLTPTFTQAATLTQSPQASAAEATTATPTSGGTVAPTMTGTPPTRTSTPRPTVTSTPRATDTPLPTRTATQTVGPPFVVADQKKVCDAATNPPLLQVQVNDGVGKPVPGVEAIVTWDGGQDSFYTGLKPDVNPGYADFVMTVGTVYTLRLADGGEPVNNLSTADCGNLQQPGGWLITFKQP